MRKDIKAKITLFKTDDGGRQSAIVASQFRCIATIGNENFSCVLDIVSSLSSSMSAELNISFLYPELALPKLVVGSNFKLRESQYIGTAEVISIY